MPNVLLLVAALAGCHDPAAPAESQTAYPDMRVSRSGTEIVEFGTVSLGERATQTLTIENNGALPLGIQQVTLHSSGTPDAFAVDLQTAAVSCDGEQVSVEAGLFVLPGGCQVPVEVAFAPLHSGTSMAAFEVVTVNDAVRPPDRAYFADPHNHKSTTILRGEAPSRGQISLSPRRLNFGQAWPGESASLSTYIDNKGDTDIFVSAPRLDEDCTAFQIRGTGLGDGGVVPPGGQGAITLTFGPEDPEEALCVMTVSSDSETEPTIEVPLWGNFDEDPDNSPPTVSILSPALGSFQSGDVTVTVLISDPDQPPDSLHCVITAETQLERELEPCAVDSSGSGSVLLYGTLFADGPETLSVTVRDHWGLTAQAATTISVAQPAQGDQDRDGYGTLTGDCDDDDSSRYPGAVEQHNAIDDDCDSAIDEGTDGRDDDGDSVSELDGDCDDTTAAVYPGAPEEADHIDNDCDGLIDEGTAFDDQDGDGFAPTDGDCDDHDPARSPSAIEYCADGVDNDCDEQIDLDDLSGCAVRYPDPEIIGGCLLEHRTMTAGQATHIAMVTNDSGPGARWFSWSITAATAEAPGTAQAASIAWTAPEATTEDALFVVHGAVTHESGAVSDCVDAIRVSADPVTDVLLAKNTGQPAR